jgi:hypothetical protein
LGGIYREGFRLLGSSISLGAHLSFTEIKKTFSVNPEKPQHLAAATTAPSESLWCWLKGLIGLDCVSSTKNLAVETPQVRDTISPIHTPPLTPSVSDTKPTDVVAVTTPRPTQTSPVREVLSFNTIVASLKNIFAPLSTVNSLEYRVSTLEANEGLTFGTETFGTDTQVRADLLALSQRVDALRSQGCFKLQRKLRLRSFCYARSRW